MKTKGEDSFKKPAANVEADIAKKRMQLLDLEIWSMELK